MAEPARRLAREGARRAVEPLRSRPQGTSPNTGLAGSSLEEACGTLSEGQGPVAHSDRGRRYFWPGWIAICERNELVR